MSGADINYVERLDSEPRKKEKPQKKAKAQKAAQKSATQTQPAPRSEVDVPLEVIDFIGGGGWTRTSDLRIMRPSL
jgi:hypothetical protein